MVQMMMAHATSFWLNHVTTVVCYFLSGIRACRTDKATTASVLKRGSKRRISDEGETVTFMMTTEEFFSAFAPIPVRELLDADTCFHFRVSVIVWSLQWLMFLSTVWVFVSGCR